MKIRKIEMGVAGPGMIPVINIVFLFLMFFMIAINFENTKADEREKLPREALAKPPEVSPEHELLLNFSYERDDSGARIKRVPEIFYNQRFVEVDQIGPGLEQEKRVLERLHGKSAVKNVTVLIRADADVPTGLVQELVKKCQDAGFTRFSLRATSEEL